MKQTPTTLDGQDSAAGVTRPTARMGIELAVPAGNNPGVLAQVLRSVAARGVNILAYCTSFDLDRFTILLVTDAALAAKTALAEAGLNCTGRSVVLVSAEDRAGTPAALFNQLSDARIDIRYAYVASLKPPALCAVFSTVDDQRALRVLAGTDLAHTASRQRYGEWDYLVALGVSVKTVDAHRANVMHKLHLHSVTDLLRYTIHNQIIAATAFST